MKLYNQLERFREYSAKNPFEVEELVTVDNKKYFRDELVVEGRNHAMEGEGFLNVGYTLRGSASKVLSNLHPYEFEFRGKKASSVEAVIQSLKIKDPDIQSKCWDYSGLNASYLKALADPDWERDGILFWQGEPIDRHSEAYTHFVEELYVSVMQNMLYERALSVVPPQKYLLHSIGKADPTQTTLTRAEFETHLNQLKNFVQDERHR